MIEGQFGRADLLRIRAELNDDVLEKTAVLAGYTKKVESRSADSITRIKEEPPAESLQQAKSAKWAPVPLWRVTEQKSFHRLPLPATKQSNSSTVTSDWSNRPDRLVTTKAVNTQDVAKALDCLRVQFDSKSPDISVLTDRIARGEMALPLSLQKKQVMPKVCILIDRSRRLVPFWKWQDQWAERLCIALDSTGVEVAVCRERSMPQSLRGIRQQQRWSISDAEAVLLLGDAGYAGGHQYKAWWRHLRGRILAPACVGWLLSPIAVPPSFNSGWNLLPLHASGELVTSEQVDSLDLLFTLVSVAVRIEPGLVSELRELITAPAALDAMFWQHPNLSSDSSVAATLGAEAQIVYRKKFTRLCRDPNHHELLKRALIIIREWRAELPKEIWFEEVLSLPAQAHQLLDEPQDLKDAQEFVTELARKGAGFPGAMAHEWLKRVFVRDPEISAQPDAVQVAFSQLWRAVHPHSNQPPRGYQPGGDSQLAESQWLLTVSGTSGGQLQIHEQPVAEPGSDTTGSRIGQIRKGNPETVLQCDGQRSQILNGMAAVTETVRKVQIRTDCEEITLVRTTKPEWASAAGCDRYGLWVEIQIETEWSRNNQSGRPCTPLIQKLRWIPPGEFWMGSPENETGRWDDEGPQHRVRLTEGYWMFDTPVTQALWQSVMVDNPSYFVSDTRPVEQVSFKDAESFVQRINSQYPDLKLSLPTETQWEYACRAGCEQATYAGPMQIVGERHAPILSNIAWYGGNSSDGFELENGYNSSDWGEREKQGDKSGTHPVATKQPNQWGLYDMLGNVWEWCDSGWGDYEGGFSENPTGSEASARVVRGGSWYNVARLVRAAARVRHEPGRRDDGLGFRCLRVSSA